ncbi:hypothetical protein KFK09_023762 [Dendrobium nobile]|uniref:Uncharacterized protein n=1 Tax=Dendrobium nobile TaxID=94219 RepID=A0A8T3AC72_DENNO|nr:hypothetical protein KFK09_023762 [Dendrobium nobile]
MERRNEGASKQRKRNIGVKRRNSEKRTKTTKKKKRKKKKKKKEEAAWIGDRLVRASAIGDHAIIRVGAAWTRHESGRGRTDLGIEAGASRGLAGPPWGLTVFSVYVGGWWTRSLQFLAVTPLILIRLLGPRFCASWFCFQYFD